MSIRSLAVIGASGEMGRVLVDAARKQGQDVRPL
jgi:putative NADH-flavin reductase